MNWSWLHLALKLVHVLAMAFWLGGPPIALVGVRDELAAGGATALAALSRLSAMTKVFVAAGFTTVLSGAGMIAIAGGPSRVATRFLVGAGLSVLVFFIGGGVIRPTLNRLGEHFRAGHGGEAAAPLVRRFLFAARSEDTLRLVILALMILPLF